MAMLAFNVGLDALTDWETADYRWLLVQDTFTVSESVTTVADVLTPSPEVTVAGYARQAVDTAVRTVNDTDNRIVYTCADPDFGTLAGGESVGGALLYRTVTDDSDSIPIGFWPLVGGAMATDAIDPFTLAIDDGIVTYVDQAA